MDNDILKEILGNGTYGYLTGKITSPLLKGKPTVDADIDTFKIIIKKAILLTEKATLASIIKRLESFAYIVTHAKDETITKQKVINEINALKKQLEKKLGDSP